MNFIDIKAQQKQKNASGKTLRQKIDSNIRNVLNHGKYIHGPEVKKLEGILCKFAGTHECIASEEELSLTENHQDTIVKNLIRINALN